MQLTPPPVPERCPECGNPVTAYTPETEAFNGAGTYFPSLAGQPVHIPSSRRYGAFYFSCWMGR